ncbi:centrosomal protein of 120 kda, partial [Cystoisospora suis]
MAELSSEPLYYERGIPCVFVSLQFKAKIVVLPSHNALENEDGDNYHSSRREREKEEDEEEEGEKKKTKQGQQRQEEEVNEREEGEEIEYKKKKNRKEIRPRRKRSCRVRLSEVEGVLDDLSSTASGYFVCKLHKLLKRCGEVNEDNEEKKKKIGEEEEEEEREEQSPSSFFDRYTCKVFGSLDEVSDFLCHIGELYLVIIPMKEYSTKMNTYRRQKKDEGKNLVHVSSSPPPSSNTIRTSPSIRLRTPVCMLDSREDLSSGDASRQPRKTDRRVSFSSLPPLSQSPSSFSSSSSHGEDEEAEKKDVKPPLDLPRNMSPSQQNLVNPSGSFEEEEEEVEEEERYVTFSLKEIFENGSLSVPASSSLHRQHPFSSSSSLYFYNEVQLDPGDDGTLLWASLYLQEYLVPYGFHRSHPSLPSLDTGYPFLLSLSVIQNRSVRTLLQGGGAEGGGGGGGKEGGVALHQDERDSNRHDADEKKRKPQEGSSYSHLTQNAGSLLLSLRLNSSKRLCHLTSSSSSFLSNEKLSSSSSSSSSGDSSSSSLFSPCTFTLPLVGNW